MIICGIDPGTKSPGFSVFQTDMHGPGVGQWLWCDDCPPPFLVDMAVVESGWTHGAMGKLAMWGLGFRACMQLMSVRVRPVAHSTAGALRYTITPDAWRDALPKIPGQLTIQSRHPKEVTVNRLRIRYGFAKLEDGGPSDDVVESRGITEGAVHMLARQFKKDRKGLKEVK